MKQPLVSSSRPPRIVATSLHDTCLFLGAPMMGYHVCGVSEGGNGGSARQKPYPVLKLRLRQPPSRLRKTEFFAALTMKLLSSQEHRFESLQMPLDQRVRISHATGRATSKRIAHDVTWMCTQDD